MLYVKLRPYLAEVRSKTGYPDYLINVEKVVMSHHDAEARLGSFTRYMARQAEYAAEGRQAHFLEGAPLDVAVSLDNAVP
jgi:hypothetical protein